jgi:hypothetical protein
MGLFLKFQEKSPWAYFRVFGEKGVQTNSNKSINPTP